jgi:hypothetical protein
MQLQGTPRQARPVYHFIPAHWLQKYFPRHYQRCEGRLGRDKAKGDEWAVEVDDGPYEGHCDGGIYSRDSCPHAAKIPPTSQALFCVYSFFFFLTKDIGAATLYIGWLLQQLRRRFRYCWNLASSPQNRLRSPPAYYMAHWI